MTFKILRLPEVKEQCGISRSAIYQGMKEGTFPRAIPLGTRMVGWSESEINDWIENKLKQRDQAKEGEL